MHRLGAAVLVAAALAATACASRVERSAPPERPVPADPVAASAEWKVRGWNAVRRGDHAAAARAFEKSIDANFDGSNAATLVREIALAGDADGAVTRRARWRPA